MKETRLNGFHQTMDISLILSQNKQIKLEFYVLIFNIIQFDAVKKSDLLSKPLTSGATKIKPRNQKQLKLNFKESL